MDELILDPIKPKRTKRVIEVFTSTEQRLVHKTYRSLAQFMIETQVLKALEAANVVGFPQIVANIS